MKKLIILFSLGSTVLVLSNCGPSQKVAANKPAPLTYEGNMQALISANCSPCHFPSKGGNKKAYDTYASVKTDIDEIIRRIELAPAERGFMPFKRSKLSDSTINVFKQWRTDGVMEK